MIRFANDPQNGHQICKDSVTGIWFWTTRFRIEQAINHANRQLYHEGYLDFYNFLAFFKVRSSTALHQLGWNLNKMADLVDLKAEYKYDLQVGVYIQLSYNPNPEMYYLD